MHAVIFMHVIHNLTRNLPHTGVPGMLHKDDKIAKETCTSRSPMNLDIIPMSQRQPLTLA